jgi:hypothetical protein
MNKLEKFLFIKEKKMTEKRKSALRMQTYYKEKEGTDKVMRMSLRKIILKSCSLICQKNLTWKEKIVNNDKMRMSF